MYQAPRWPSIAAVCRQARRGQNSAKQGGIPRDQFLIIHGKELCIAAGDCGNGKKREAPLIEEF
jgi:hypothetical protein